MRLETRKIDVPTPDGNCDSFLVFPAARGPYPAVLLLMDAFGPRGRLYEMAKTIASRGYCVLLPNLFYRVRRAPVTTFAFPVRSEQMPDLVKEIMPLFQTLPPETGVKDIGVFMDYLSGLEGARKGKVGIAGYCLGGGFGIRAAAAYPDRIAAVGSFHAGNLATDAENSPHLLLTRIKAELHIGHADNDRSMPPEQIHRLEEALKRSGARYEAEVYAGAAHGFTMADLPAYHPAACEKHWEKLFALFARTLS